MPSESGAEKPSQGGPGPPPLDSLRRLQAAPLPSHLSFPLLVIPALPKHCPFNPTLTSNRWVGPREQENATDKGDSGLESDLIVNCEIRWGNPVGGGHGVRSVKFIKHFGHQLQVMFWTGYKEHEPVRFSPVHTVAIETLTSVLKLLSESPPTPAYPIITHWGTVVSSTKKMELRLPKPREGAVSFPHPSPRQGPPSTPQDWAL